MLPTITFRLLGPSDFPLLQCWLQEPHVAAWWKEPLDLAGVQAKYGPRVEGIEPTHVYVIHVSSKPIGWIQWYRWSDYPSHALQLGAAANTAGIDLALGERDAMGKGLGPRIIRQFLDEIVFIDPAIRAVVTDPEEKNVRSLRAFEKEGFTVLRRVQLRGEDVQRCVVQLNRPDAG